MFNQLPALLYSKHKCIWGSAEMCSIKYIVTRVDDPSKYSFGEEAYIRDISDLIDAGMFMSNGVIVYEKYKYNSIKRTPFKYECTSLGNNVFTYIDNGLSYSIHKAEGSHNIRLIGIKTILEEMLNVVYKSEEIESCMLDILPNTISTEGLRSYMWRIVDSLGIQFYFRDISIDSECLINDNLSIKIYDLMYMIKLKYFKITI